MTLKEEKILKDYIKNIIKENYINLAEEDDNKESSRNGEKKKVSKDTHAKNKRSRVIARLKEPETNCAEIMRKLWKPSKDDEDAARSYFYKCRDGELNDSGIPYKFSDDEINKLYQFLTSSF